MGADATYRAGGAIQDPNSPGPGNAPIAAHDPPERLDARQLFRAHAGFVAGFLRRMGAAPDEVDDLVQDVFVIAHHRGGYVAGEAKPTTWLASIAMGELRNLRRKRERRSKTTTTSEEAVDTAVGPESAVPVHAIERADRVRLVQAALERLPEDRRALFMLYELEGESCQSIAAGLGIPVGTVYSRLHATRKAFAAAVRELRGERQGDEPA